MIHRYVKTNLKKLEYTSVRNVEKEAHFGLITFIKDQHWLSRDSQEYITFLCR